MDKITLRISRRILKQGMEMLSMRLMRMVTHYHEWILGGLCYEYAYYLNLTKALRLYEQ